MFTTLAAVEDGCSAPAGCSSCGERWSPHPGRPISVAVYATAMLLMARWRCATVGARSCVITVIAAAAAARPSLDVAASPR